MLRVVEQAPASRARASRSTAYSASRQRAAEMGIRRWVVELGPAAVVLVAIWAKLIHVGLLLPGISWAGAEPLGPRAALHAYPDMLSATLAVLLLPLVLLAMLPRVARFAALVLLNLTITCLAVADLLHVRFYGDVWSVSSLAATSMLGWVLHSLQALTRASDSLYFLDVVLGLVVLPFYARACRRVPATARTGRARTALVSLVAAILLALPTARLAFVEGNVFAYSTIRLEVAMAIGLLPYHLTEVLTLAARGEQAVDATDIGRLRSFLAERRQAQPPSSELFGAAGGKNVLVISAESVQAFVIGLVVDGQPVAPRLTELARESLHFSRHYEPTHLGSTADAEFAVMQSLYPLPVGVVASRHARNQYRGLPAVLAERGYATFSAVGAVSYFWNMHELHPRYGFQRSYYEDRFRVDERIIAWISDRLFFEQVEPYIREQPEPFMGFLLSSSSHHPYVIPEEYRELKLGRFEGSLLGDYLHAVHYFDRQLGVFLDRLRADGLLDRTLLVVYGDHQGFLFDEPGLPDLLGYTDWNEYHHFRVVKQTPLLIRLPGGAAAGVRTEASNHLDVAPTVLGLLGVQDDTTVMLGRDLTRGGDPLVVFRDGSFADSGHYFANRFTGARASRCYVAETGTRVDCAGLAGRQRAARELLEVSDLIVQGDLVPVLRPDGLAATQADGTLAP